MVKNHLNELAQFLDQKDTILYKDFIINIKSINDPNIYKLGYEMRDTCNDMNIKKFKQSRELFLPLCIESHDG